MLEKPKRVIGYDGQIDQGKPLGYVAAITFFVFYLIFQIVFLTAFDSKNSVC